MRQLLASLVIVAIASVGYQVGMAQGPPRDEAALRASIPLTAAQVQQGRGVYNAHCVSCHGPLLSDGIARPLVGRHFRANWGFGSAAGLRDYMRRQMPPGLGGSLSEEEYTQVLALILRENGYETGDVPLATEDEALVKMGLFPWELNTSGGLALDATLPPVPNPAEILTPVTDEMLKNPPPGDWLTWRRTQDGLGFSPLAQITPANVSGLNLAWSYTLSPGPNVATPVVHDGVLFVPSAGDQLDALDAQTGELLWTYQHESADSGRGFGRTRRNIALYGDRVYFPLSRSIAVLDGSTGALLWEAPTDTGIPGGPLVANGTIFQGLGRGGAGVGGSMQALDAETGSALWRWFTIAKSDEPGGNTWGGMPDAERSGAGIWTTAYLNYDLNLLYFGTGNTYDTVWLAERPEYLGQHDALYTNTTVAVDPETGEMAWYFQHQAGDPHDLDWVFERLVVPLSIDGTTTKVVVTMGKPGVLDAVDAATGEYLFSLDAGIQNFITEIDPETGRKTIDPALIPVPGAEQVYTVCPNWLGVKNWLPGSINPDTGVAYMALNESCMDLTPVFPGETSALSSGFMSHTRPMPDSDGRVGRMQAFDLQNRRVLWTARQRAPMTSGVLATAGGVLFAGDLSRTFTAYDEQTGSKLWSTRLGDVPSSTPISYMVDGRQYVAMVVGYGSLHSLGFLPLVPEIFPPTRSGSAIYVFALP